MTKIQVRRGTAAQWTSANPVLAAGEPGWDSTNNIQRVGDGVTAWASLPVVNNATYGQLWATPTASATLTGTLATWTVTAVDCTAGAGARTLPAASSVVAGTGVCAKKADTSANALTVSRAGSDLIYGTGAGATSKTLTLAGEAVEFVSNGVDKWTVRSSDTPSGVLASTYAGIADRRLSNRFVFLGDSITLQSDSFGAPHNHGECFPTYACLLSGQQIQKVANAGVAGNTSAQMLARFDTDVTPFAPGTVFLLAGTNDTGTGVSLATFQANIRAIVVKIRGIGAQPVLSTIPPCSAGTPTNRRQLIVQFNHWLRIYASQQKIPLVDFYALLADPTNGNWLSAYPSGDGIHPGSVAGAAMGSLVATTLASRLAPASVQVCRDDIDENNLLLKGCFGGYSGSSLPTGYTDNAGTPTGHTLSYTTDALVAGQMLTDTQVAGVLRELTIGWTIGADTLSATSAAGASTVTVATINPTRGVLFLGSGATAEVCRVASISGTGPYVATLVHNTVYTHSSGEACVVNAAPGDTIACSGVYTSDGGVAFSAKINYTPSGSYFPVSALAAAVTRATFYGEDTIPVGTTIMTFRPKYAAGTSVISIGQVGVYNLTRGGVLL